ncbi:MAG: hypothetical protein JWM41_1208 [Gemmatimonadetes bacterium]|nr:hypothetical protein [Gemmatimonadota bacterium]
MLDEDSSVVLLRRARQADASFLPAELDLLRATVDRFTFAERRRAAASGIPDRALARCLAAVAVQQQTRLVFDSLQAIERTFGRSRCTVAMIADIRGRMPPHVRERPLDLATWHAAVGELALYSYSWATYGDAIRDAGDTVEAIAVLDQGVREITEPLNRLRLSIGLLQLVTAHGDSARMRSIRGGIDAMVQRDGRPAMRFNWLTEQMERAPDSRTRDSLARLALPIARQHRARAALFTWFTSDGATSLDHGDIARAVDALRSAAALADTIGGTASRSRMHARLGRALVKQGRVGEGIAELRRSLALADPGDRYTLADINHNLGHAYESAGVTDSAVRAIDRFAALAAPFQDDGIGIISLRDAGAIRWDAGLHASARVAFDRMVRLIVRRQAYFFYAGEYYERIGDLARARRFYARVSEADSEEGARALAGSVRVFESLGLADSAAALARRHDRAPSTAEEIPLLPAVLVRTGRSEPGLAAMRKWIATQSPQGNVERTARARTHLAGLLLEAGQFGDAIAEARRAAEAASGANLVEARARAMLVEGTAQLRAHGADSAARTLMRADSLLCGRASTELAFELSDALGDALAEHGQVAAALVAYDRAASMGERMRTSFDEDLDQARVHAEKIAPLDGAMRTLLSGRDRLNTELLTRWSQRRKEALFADARTRRTASIAELRRGMGAHDALVDYVVLDSIVAAIVVTPSRAGIVTLPITARQLGDRIAALRRPFSAYNGRVDVARLFFDTRNAAALHAALVQPLDSLTQGASHLIVIPDGPLHLLPFDALVTNAGATPAFLVDRYEVSYLPSAGFARGSDAGGRRPGSLLFVGYGVEGDTTEWTRVAAAWRGKSQRLLGSGASEERVTAMAPRFDILHFAVHARADVTDPLASHLALAAMPGQDGLFHASEIERVQMSPSLVVLSACETDAGAVLRGVGAMGLARAFLVAGARGVVGTEWSVGPAALQLMSVFYSRLAAGDRPATALRTAKLALRRDSRTANPFYWAPFTLTEVR